MLLQPGQPPPPLAHPVARLGDVVTCRIAARDVPAVRSHSSVISLKASRTFAAPEVACAAGPGPAGPPRRGLDGLTGRHVVMAFLDWGCDFAHPNFRTADGRTRLLALWDQGGVGAPGNRYGYGRIHDRAAIDRALTRPDPYAALGYHPCHSDPLGRGAHGTHVMDIAAGNGRLAGSAPGLAPEAELVFVQLAARTPARCDLGDSMRLLEAVDFVCGTAGARPWVANLSLGRTGGPHTGRSLVERALDAVLEEAPGRFIAQSCGNYLDRHLHAEGWVRPGGVAALDWHLEPADLTPNELEVWYAGCDRFEVELQAPGGERFRAPLDQTAAITIDGREVGRLHHRADDPLTRDHHVD
ncbi:MAG TPA: S8 family serine peptidase, partial [Vicinamibacteria bacterium]|nr:S8 family serine peptidase [Vicinamibacteria bacterium]